MPALPSVSKVLKIVLFGLMGEDTNVVNRWFMQYSGTAPAPSDLDTLAASVLTTWAAHMASKIQAGYATERVEIEDLSSATGAVGSATGSHAGTDTGVTLPASMCFILKFPVARRYRGGHPRMYITGISNAHLTDDQTWDHTYGASVATAFDDWMNAIDGAVWSGGTSLVQVNVSYYEGFAPHLYPSGRYRNIPTLRGTPLVDLLPTTAFNPRPGSQRRRNLQGS